MKTVTVKMNERELKRFESFKEAEKIVRGIKRGLREINQAKSGKTQLKSARQLANEI
jgi:predicted nucleic acid-binding OB-fold protein